MYAPKAPGCSNQSGVRSTSKKLDANNTTVVLMSRRHFSLYFWERLSLGSQFGNALLHNGKTLQKLRIDHFALTAQTFTARVPHQSMRLLTQLELSDSILDSKMCSILSQLMPVLELIHFSNIQDIEAQDFAQLFSSCRRLRNIHTGYTLLRRNTNRRSHGCRSCSNHNHGAGATASTLRLCLRSSMDAVVCDHLLRTCPPCGWIHIHGLDATYTGPRPDVCKVYQALALHRTSLTYLNLGPRFLVVPQQLCPVLSTLRKLRVGSFACGLIDEELESLVAASPGLHSLTINVNR